MKFNKIITILMAILLTFALCACGGESESSDDSSTNTSTDSSDVADGLSGKFMLYSMTAEGTTMDYETLKMIGMDAAYLEIKSLLAPTMKLSLIPLTAKRLPLLQKVQK